jgi:hypothetical protein
LRPKAEAGRKAGEIGTSRVDAVKAAKAEVTAGNEEKLKSKTEWK